MGSCYTGDHTAEDRTSIRTDITTCNTKEPRQKYRLGMVNNRLLWGLNMFYWKYTSRLWVDKLRCVRKCPNFSQCTLGVSFAPGYNFCIIN